MDRRRRVWTHTLAAAVAALCVGCGPSAPESKLKADAVADGTVVDASDGFVFDGSADTDAVVDADATLDATQDAADVDGAADVAVSCPVGSPCDDGDPCTGGELCGADGGCGPGPIALCACTKQADCASKEDGNPCNGTLYCDTASMPPTCAVNPASVVVCDASADDACLQATCSAQNGVCAQVAVNDGKACDDGDACSGGDQCDGGSCVGAVDICKCVQQADCVDEDDGDLCNGTLFCDLTSGECKINPATVVNCANVDDTGCLHQLCAPKTGKCAIVVEPDTTLCVDGNPCTDSDACAGGVCTGGANLCVCAKDADCVSKEDGDVCNGTLYCHKGPAGSFCELNPATVITCPSVDDTACGVATCVKKTGACAMKVAAKGTPCDADGTLCTPFDSCVDGACVASVPTCDCLIDADCAKHEDGDLCNGTLYCDKSGPAPKCVVNPASVLSCPTVGDSACIKTTCAPLSGKCTSGAVAAGSGCDDGDVCTKGEVCVGGACAAGVVVCKLCGDGALQAGEACDDGNNDDGDGCTAACALQWCTTWKASTLAGNGDPVDKDGPIATAKVYYPAGIALSASGGVFWSGNGSTPKIRKLTLDGQVVTVAGSNEGWVDGPASSAKFNEPNGLAFDGAGNLYVADRGNERIRRIDAQGNVTTLAGQWSTGLGDGSGASAKFAQPIGLAIGSDGVLVVGDTNNNAIRSLTLVGDVATIAGAGPGSVGAQDGVGAQATFSAPRGVSVAGSGVVYVADRGNNRIRAISAAGVVSTLAGDSTGYQDGKGSALFKAPEGVVIGFAGVIYVLDSGNNRIRRIAADGNVSTIAGPLAAAASGDSFVDGIGSAARFAHPLDAVMVNPGRILVTDNHNNRLRALDCLAWTSKTCGNGAIDAGEACDDGNAVNGDGCSDGCQ